MKYKPLDPARNEIGLVTVLPKADRTDSKSPEVGPSRLDLVWCTVDTVCLDDFTEKWLAFRNSSAWEQPSGLMPWLSSCAQSAGCDFGEDYSIADLARIDWMRWKWGDSQILSYAWGDPNNAKPILIGDSIVQVTENL
jgi:hypothetical protein